MELTVRVQCRKLDAGLGTTAILACPCQFAASPFVISIDSLDPLPTSFRHFPMDSINHDVVSIMRCSVESLLNQE
jgi:hypothetical protein